MKVRLGWLGDPLLHLMLFGGLLAAAAAWNRPGRDADDDLSVAVVVRRDPPAPPPVATATPRRPAGVTES